MCSRFFVCRGCGRAEPRHLALQPERDMQAARAPGVLRGALSPREVAHGSAGTTCLLPPVLPSGTSSVSAAGGGGAATPRLSSSRCSARPTSRATSRGTVAAAGAPSAASAGSPCSSGSTISMQARLASPRLVVKTADGWHRAGMCRECYDAFLKWQERAQAEEAPSRPRGGGKRGLDTPVRAAEREEASPLRRATTPLDAHRAASPGEALPLARVTDGWTMQPAAAPTADAAGGSRPPTAPPLAPAVAEFLRSQPTPRWLREYLQPDSAASSRPHTVTGASTG